MKKLSAVNSWYFAEINWFVAVTSDPEFCLETTLLYNGRNLQLQSREGAVVRLGRELAFHHFVARDQILDPAL